MRCTIQADVVKAITGLFTKIANKTLLDVQTSGVYITVSGATVSFRLHQFDLFVCYNVEGTECAEGTVFVSAQALDMVTQTVVDTLVTFELSETVLLVKTKSSSSDLLTLTCEDPKLFSFESPQGKPTISLDREILLQGFKRVQHAAAESVVKPEIASVNLYTKDGSLYFVATDSLRLAEIRFLAENSTTDVNIIIPIKNIQKIVRILENITDSAVDLFIDGDVVHFQTETVYLRTGSVQGSFPNYTDIIPTTFALEATMIKSDVLNFLKKARLFANTLNRLSLGVEGKNHLFFSFSNSTTGSTKNVIPAMVKGNLTAFPSFNYAYISDILSVINDDEVVFHFVDDITKPLMIRGKTDTGLRAIVSPLLEEVSD